LHRIQAWLELRYDGDGLDDRVFALLIDFKSAFSLRGRVRIAQILYANAEYSPIWRLFHFIYSCSSTVYTSGGGEDFLSENGVIQGEVLAMDAYCQSMEAIYADTLKAAQEVDEGARAAAIADDLTIVSNLAGIAKALALLIEVCEKEAIEINLAKCVLFDAHGDAKPALPEAAELAARYGMQMAKGAVKVLGGAIGLDEDARVRLFSSMVDKKCAATCDIIKNKIVPSQCVPLLAKMSAYSGFVYIASIAPSRLVEEPIARAERAIGDAFLSRMEIEPRLVTEAVRLQLRLQARYGGFGIRTPSGHSLYAAANAYALNEAPQECWLIKDVPQENDDYSIADCLVPSIRDAYHSLRTIAELAPPNELFAKQVKDALQDPIIRVRGRMPIVPKLTLHYHTLCGQLALDEVKKDASLLQRVQDCGSASAALFLRSVPGDGGPFAGALSVDEQRYPLIVRSLLGIVHKDLPGDYRCGYCGADFDPHHSQSCKKIIKRSINSRHDQLVYVLESIVRAAGCHAQHEPKVLAHAGDRGDVLIHFVDGSKIMVDVSVAHVACKTNAGKSVADVLTARETLKYSKYAHKVPRDTSFCPFVFSSLGTIAPKADSLLRKLAQSAVENDFSIDSRLFYRHSLLRILFSLHRSNIIIQDEGVRNCRPVPRSQSVLRQ